MENKKEKRLLILIYAKWLKYSIDLKNHFQLLEGSLVDDFIALELDAFLEQKSNIITGIENVDSFLFDSIKKINKVPVFFVINILVNKEEKKEIKKMETIIPRGNQEAVEKKIKNFFEK